MSVISIGKIPAPSHSGAWTLQAIVAAAFLAAAGAKLSGQASMVQMFAQIGLGQWFRIITGIVELIGVYSLLFPRLASIGGLWLGGTMFFAVLTHLFVLHTNPAPAILLGLLSVWIAYLRRDELASLAHTITG